MSKIGYVVIAVVVAVVAGVYYFLFYKKSTVIAAAPSDLGLTESTQRADVQYDMETPLVVIGEQVLPTVAVPIISGTKFETTPSGDVVGVGGYYDSMTVTLKNITGLGAVPVAQTSTGATVGIPTDPILANLARDEYGRFVNPTTVQTSAIEAFSASLMDTYSPDGTDYTWVPEELRATGIDPRIIQMTNGIEWANSRKASGLGYTWCDYAKAHGFGMWGDLAYC